MVGLETVGLPEVRTCGGGSDKAGLSVFGSISVCDAGVVHLCSLVPRL